MTHRSLEWIKPPVKTMLAYLLLSHGGAHAQRLGRAPLWQPPAALLEACCRKPQAYRPDAHVLRVCVRLGLNRSQGRAIARPLQHTEVQHTR